MNKLISSLLVALTSAVAAGSVMAQNTPHSETRVIQVPAPQKPMPAMTHETATVIKLTHQAEAQHRRSGSPQDLARVKAMHIELARRGLRRSTQPAPAPTLYAAQ